jgi:branched-chain amino acid transport system permease protein
LPESGARLAAAVCGLAVMALFYVLLKTTWLGLAMRAAAQSRFGVQTAGVDIFRMDRIAFGIGVALAGLAGALLAPVFLVYPTNGIVTTTKGFEIIVIGGLGSILGSVVGGVLLGVIEALGSVFVSSAYKDLYGFLLLIALLVFRPTGLFGERERSV